MKSVLSDADLSSGICWLRMKLDSYHDTSIILFVHVVLICMKFISFYFILFCFVFVLDRRTADHSFSGSS